MLCQVNDKLCTMLGTIELTGAKLPSWRNWFSSLGAFLFTVGHLKACDILVEILPVRKCICMYLRK